MAAAVDPNAGASPADIASSPERFLNRELSWLDWNGRVLALAEDARQPLLERVKYLAIVASNLDEFFQVRVAGLRAQLDAGITAPSSDGRTPAQQLAEIRARVEEQHGVIETLLHKELLPALAEQRVRLVDWASLEDADRARLARLFDEQVLPVLTPQSVDRAHPFPYISNLSLNLAAVVRDPSSGENRFARVKVPGLLPRFVPLADGQRFLPVEQLIAAHLDALFPGMEIVSHHPFRLTLDAELAVDEDRGADLMAAIQSGLHRRLRMNDAVRLEIDATMPAKIREVLVSELELEADDVYVLRGPLGLSGLWSLYALARPDLKDDSWMPQTPPRLQVPDGGALDLFGVLREGDVMVHHPYDSFRTSVEAFLTQAASDPDVLAIKHTLYRTSGRDNPIVRALMRAAQTGKEVVALIELKARFDEGSNIAWARRLEQAGVHVVYGIVGLKTHAKVALVVRREGNEIRRYCHIGTGNYNPTTAETYEDVGLLSARPELGADLSDVFNYLTGCGRPRGYRRMLVAPNTMRARLLEEIRRESTPDGRIVIKVNNLSDDGIIDALYGAAAGGAEIDLIVRSTCCLRPGVAGLSERIRVRSILGRFLEHSRVFRFGHPDHTPRYFIGSADMMARNLDRRVETLVQIDDPALQARLEEILTVNLEPNALAWTLDANGAWVRPNAAGAPGSHARFQALARARANAEDKSGQRSLF